MNMMGRLSMDCYRSSRQGKGSSVGSTAARLVPHESGAATPAVGTAGTARRAGHCLIHDTPDGAGASTALRTAAETAVDLTGGAGTGRRSDHVADIVVGDDVARTDDHEAWPGNLSRTTVRWCTKRYMHHYTGSSSRSKIKTSLLTDS